jgi:hypothetical protein
VPVRDLRRALTLTAAELENLTGYKTGKRQCRWLADNAYSFDVRADGTPALSREHYEARHAPVRRRPSAMNLAALDGMK